MISSIRVASGSRWGCATLDTTTYTYNLQISIRRRPHAIPISALFECIRGSWRNVVDLIVTSVVLSIFPNVVLLYSKVPSCPWSYRSRIYDYLCNQCLSPPMFWVWILIRARSTTLCKFVSDLRQVGGFLRVLQFPPPIKLTATI